MSISAKQQLCALFNAANPSLAYPLTEADISTGTLVPYTPEDGGKANTAISVSATGESKHFEGGTTLRYTRLTLKLPDVTSTNTSTLDWNDTDYVLKVINTELAKLYPDDAFTEEELDSTDLHAVRTGDANGVPVKVEYRLWTGHIKWLGSDNILTVNIAAAKSDLSTADGELDNFS